MTTRTVNIEIYCEEDGVFAVLSEHRPDLPNPIDEPLQTWVKEEFSDMAVGEELLEAGEVEYEPNGEIVEFRRK